jgi:SAM-dependent methyltransferase
MGRHEHTQKMAFLAGEGDAWFQRNLAAIERADRAATDPVLQLVARMDTPPSRVLEIGCSDGWRLAELRRMGARECVGIDPSQAAIASGGRRYPDLRLMVGTADRLPEDRDGFDLIVFGFCLYVCDPEDHFRIASEADRLLRDNGSLIIYDFDPPYPYRNRYAHAPGLFSYKFDFSRIFLAHPHCSRRERRSFPHDPAKKMHPDNRVSVARLEKSLALAWPFNPEKDD